MYTCWRPPNLAQISSNCAPFLGKPLLKNARVHICSIQFFRFTKFKKKLSKMSICFTRGGAKSEQNEKHNSVKL